MVTMAAGSSIFLFQLQLHELFKFIPDVNHNETSFLAGDFSRDCGQVLTPDQKLVF